MGGILDDIGDLAHHAYDAVTGALSPDAPNKKPEATSAPAGDWMQRARSNAQRDANKSIDDQVAANE